ncbi:hypothetical protein EVAR_56304_1 [Eumeta japonica]|uniref:Ig-like domain-containing protein n=1 Tax=Eumeta variegata TaxID=151549 RepID=A0A4C1Z439_EUMVA|nr:hypothetical protein EVAR_56304_1 [Eumeta japonica]
MGDNGKDGTVICSMKPVTARADPRSKYQASVKSDGYRHSASLRILNLSRDDIGSYRCQVENSLGSAHADITLYSQF